MFPKCIGCKKIKALNNISSTTMVLPQQPLFNPSFLDTLIVTITPFLIALAKFALTFIATYLAIEHIINPLLQQGIKRHIPDPSLHALSSSVLSVTKWVLALAIALTLSGYGGFISALGVLSGGVAIGVGFAAKDLLSNFVAGLFILKDKPFVVGDWIEWDDNQGVIEDIDLRVTRVRTFDNEQITVPNMNLTTKAVTNPVAYDKLRQTITFGISYEDDIQQAMDIILDEAAEHGGVMDDPEPSVRITDLGDSSVALQTRIWIANPTRTEFKSTQSDLTKNVKERFDEEGVDIPYPHRTLTGSVGMSDSADE